MKRALVLAWLVTAACSKASGTPGTEPVPSASAPQASSSTAAGASSAPAAAPAPKTWRGTYKSTASALDVPPAFAKTWAHREVAGGTGEGALTLTIDAATGVVTGTVEGPLGPAVVDGDVAASTLTAAIRRKDPADRGFTGTLRGTVAADHIEGTMTLASADGAAQRSATVTLTPATP